MTKYSYESIAKSSWFGRVDMDFLRILLDPSKEYTKAEAEKILAKAKKKEVN